MSLARLSNAQRLEFCQVKSKNPKMSQSVLANWATSRSGAHITQSALSFILKKRADMECMINSEHFAE